MKKRTINSIPISNGLHTYTDENGKTNTCSRPFSVCDNVVFIERDDDSVYDTLPKNKFRSV